MVAAAMRTIYAQPDATHVMVQFDEIVTMLTGQFPDAANILNAAGDDVLAFTAFPGRALAQNLVHQPVRTRQR